MSALRYILCKKVRTVSIPVSNSLLLLLTEKNTVCTLEDAMCTY